MRADVLIAALSAVSPDAEVVVVDTDNGYDSSIEFERPIVEIDLEMNEVRLVIYHRSYQS